MIKEAITYATRVSSIGCKSNRIAPCTHSWADNVGGTWAIDRKTETRVRRDVFWGVGVDADEVLSGVICTAQVHCKESLGVSCERGTTG